MKFDHIALTSNSIQNSIDWYKSIFNDVSVIYQDETWCLIDVIGTKIAFVSPEQHPPHIAFRVSSDAVSEQLNKIYPGHVWKLHRDLSKSFYVKDPSGNFVEFIKYEEDYEK